ncbi:MAG: exodeoxyribonuclease III [Microgenomates group bacterium Gr01-1014_16]|nr:MAG: exodeoxyribonuclease III [Microgenomates group bacterium Gr01-1014_16]
MSWNVNGLRSVMQKGFGEWVKKIDADIVCLQETKIDEELLLRQDKPKGYYLFANSAQKKGYSGVLIYTRVQPQSVVTRIGWDRFDTEGRMVELKYQNFILTNLYLPHGGRFKENLEYKLQTYERLMELFKMNPENRILLGDFNVAHQEIDLERPKQNKNNIMFTSNERKQLDRVTELGFVDTFRKFYSEGGNYTWWPYIAQARQRNLGWRIDYCFVSRNLIERVKGAFILKQVVGSDHCPVGVTIEL